MNQMKLKTVYLVVISITFLSFIDLANANAISCEEIFTNDAFTLRHETQSAVREMRLDVKKLIALGDEYEAAIKSHNDSVNFAQRNGLDSSNESISMIKTLSGITEIVARHMRASYENTTLLVQYLSKHDVEINPGFKEVSLELEFNASSVSQLVKTASDHQLLSSINSWGWFFQYTLKLGDIIKHIRDQHPVLFKDPEFQKLYQNVTTGSVEYMMNQNLVTPILKRQKSGYRDINLANFFARAMTDDYNVSVSYLPGGFLDAPPVFIKAPSQLFIVLMTEITKNASEAARRRYGDKWGFAYVPKINAFEKPDRSVEVTIEDFGQPSELNYAGQLGRTTNTVENGRSGLGFGLFYIQLIADTLGYNLNYIAKGDGSGTIVTIRIPPSSNSKSY